MKNTDEPTPPRPQAYLRIGVTGHRLGPKLSQEQAEGLRATVDHILADIERLARDVVERDGWAFSSRRPVLSTISALAEGSDRIVAEAGLAAEWPLNVILPFVRADYRTDFEREESRLAFDTLLTKAGAVFELDGKREVAARAYEAAGLLMLANADIVIAIWDQMPADGIGGTALIVEHAMAEGVPVILIDPRSPAEASILWRADSSLPTARSGIEGVPRRPLAPNLADIVAIMLAPPRDDSQRIPLKELYVEQERRWNIAMSYPVLLFLLGVRRLRWSDLRVPPRRQDSATLWREYLQGHQDDEFLRSLDTDTLLKAYSFVDHLSIRYAQVYRSAYVFNYAAAATAVLLASIGLLQPSLDFKAVMVAVEIGLIVSILIVLHEGGRRQWHRRWLEYRRLAETLRHLRMLAPTAAAARLDRPGNRVGRAYGWVSWYARAVEREIPVPNLAVDQRYMAAVRDAVRNAELKSQIAYNLHNAEAMELAGERLHLAGTFLFWATLAICVGFLAIYFVRHDEADKLRELTVFLTALFPAIGAALSAIRAQGDFQTVAKRSHETAINLEDLDHALEHEPLEFARLADRVEKTVDVMMADNAEWHVMFRTRPLSLPA